MGGYTARAQSFFYSGHSAQWLFETFKDVFIYSSLLLAGFPMANDTLTELRLLQCDWSNQRGSKGSETKRARFECVCIPLLGDECRVLSVRIQVGSLTTGAVQSAPAGLTLAGVWGDAAAMGALLRAER